MPQTPRLQSAHAILLLKGKYILQLREDKPNIIAPGQWSLFGGLIQVGETPIQSVTREIFEELSIQPFHYDFLWHIDYMGEYEKEMTRSWFFEADVSMVWPEHILKEGQALGAFEYKETMNLVMPWVMRETLNRYEVDKKLRRSA